MSWVLKPDDVLYSKGIIFVEGKDDIEVISELIRKIDESIMADKINIIQAHSCENLKFYANAELLINTNFSVPVLILRDADIKKPEVLKDNLYEGSCLYVIK
jgi:putative ATP-dependent endonuclease of OLD family